MNKISPRPTADQEQKLMAKIWDEEIRDNPYNFIMFIFPWGRKGTPLEHHKGPRKWQRNELENIAAHIAKNKNLMRSGKAPEIYKSATVSGRGPGKSTFFAWLTLWMMSTQIGSSTIVTANNEDQLKTKTWAELGKWHTLSLNSHWFDKQSLSLKPQEWFTDVLKRQIRLDSTYYYAQALLWSEENPDAFAGAHNQAGILLVFDEASGIPPSIWKVSEGFFTEPILHRYHFVFSNPRRNTGEFFECFHRFRDYWRRRQIDSRTVEGIDVKALQDIVDKYGEDSDEARIEVKGEFPRQGDKQFISREIVAHAQERKVEDDDWAPLIMGVDPARFGDDATVIRWRQGRNGKVIPPTVMKGADNMEVANQVAALINQFNPDAVCIDAGNGTGIIDRLRELRYKIEEVWFGSKSPEEEYANFRTYLWAEMRSWLGGASIDGDTDLADDLVSPEYRFMTGSDKQRLETKEELKARGFASPDNADALACTFAVKPARRDLHTSRHRRKPNSAPKDVNYKIF